MSEHVVVIGGGITGLAAVEHLTRESPELRVTLLEGSERLGGHIRTALQDDLVVETGPDVLLAAKPAAIELAKRVGLGDRLRGTSPSARGSYLYTSRGLKRLPDGMTGLVPSRLGPFARTSLLSPLAKARVAMEYFIKPRADDADESIESFVVRRLGRRMYDQLAEPLLSGISAGNGARLSMATMFPQLRALEKEYGGLLRGMLARRGEKKPEPAASPFVSFPKGLSELVDAVLRTIRQRDPAGKRVAINTSSPVRRINRIVGGPFNIEFSSGETMDADAVILATPTYVSSSLLRGVHGPLSRKLAEIDYESTVTVSMAYARSAIPMELDATGYVVPRKLGRQVLACTWASAKFEGRAPKDQALFRVFFGGAGRSDLTGASNGDLRWFAMNELREVMGITEPPEFVRVDRFVRAMPQYYVGHLDRIAAIQALASEVPGLHLAGAAYGGVGIPDCIRSAERVATALLAELAAHPPLAMAGQ